MTGKLNGGSASGSCTRRGAIHTPSRAKVAVMRANCNGVRVSVSGQPDPNWPAWYAEYMVREQSGVELPR